MHHRHVKRCPMIPKSNQSESVCLDSISPELLRSCMAANDVTELIPYLREGIPCPHDFPEVHRLVDFVISSSFGYRVCRCAACHETIFILETTSPASDEPGVPLDVTGDGLARWVADERAQDEDEDTPACHYSHYGSFDWNRYRQPHH